MGLSASQSRLLSLTSRLSDLELRSQSIANSKLRLSEASSAASADYNQALNKQKISICTGYEQDGSKIYDELTYNNLTGVDSPLGVQYGLANSYGNIVVTPDQAAKFESSPNLEAFLEANGAKIYHYPNGMNKTQYEEALNAAQTVMNNAVLAHEQAEANINMTESDIEAFKVENFLGYNSDKKTWEYVKTTTSVQPMTRTITQKVETASSGDNVFEEAQGVSGDPIYNVIGVDGRSHTFMHKGKAGDTYNVFEGDNLKILGTYAPYGGDASGTCIDNITILTGTDVLNLDKNNKLSVNGKEQKYGTYELADGTKYIYSFSGFKIIPSDGSGEVDINNSVPYSIDPSGEFDDLGGILGAAIKNNGNMSEADCNRYAVNLQKETAEYKYNDVISNLSNKTQKSGNPSVSYAYAENDGQSIGSSTTAGAETLVSSRVSGGQRTLVYTYNETTTKTEVVTSEKAPGEYKIKSPATQAQYDALLAALEAARRAKSDATDAYNKGRADYATLINGVTFSYTEDKPYYTNLYNRMCQGYSEATDTEVENFDNPDWLAAQLSCGNLIIEKCIDGKWNSSSYTTDSSFIIESDTVDLAKAEAEYEQVMNEVQAKDKRFDLQLKTIDTEHNAIQTEMDSVQKVLDKNIEKSLKIFDA